MNYNYIAECRHCLTELFDGINVLIIDEHGFATINNQKTGLIFDEVLQNTPCVINGILYAVWDMRNNYNHWDDVDVACGIAHELFHCAQIKYGKWKKCCSEDYFSCIPSEIDCLNDKLLLSIPQEIINTIEIEGMSLYFELCCKSRIKCIPVNDLLEEYKLFASKNIHFIPYYIGAVMAFQKDQMVENLWEDYFGING